MHPLLSDVCFPLETSQILFLALSSSALTFDLLEVIAFHELLQWIISISSCLFNPWFKGGFTHFIFIAYFVQSYSVFNRSYLFQQRCFCGIYALILSLRICDNGLLNFLNNAILNAIDHICGSGNLKENLQHKGRFFL